MNYKDGILLSLSVQDELENFPGTLEDQTILQALLEEINNTLHLDLHYLSELDHFYISGSGEIVRKYIFQFSSETIRASLLDQMVRDRIPDCITTLCNLYRHFRETDASTHPPFAHIYVRYDNAFPKLSLKKKIKEFVSLADDPLDFLELPITMRKIASYRAPEIEAVLHHYLEDFVCEKDRTPKDSFQCRERCFSAIYGMRYYPSDKNLTFAADLIKNPDKDIKKAAENTYNYMLKKISRC